MAITEVVRLEIQTQQAKQNMDSLTATINEQKLITIELERELKRLEQALRDTPKNALAAQRDLNQQINHVKDSISDQRLSLKELQVQQSQTRDIDKYTNKQAELNTTFKASSLRIRDLDAVTGGYGARIKSTAMIFQAVQKAALGFVGSLNTIKVALISTGIGALVVALGAIVAYWDDIKAAVTGVTKEMESQLKVSKQLVDSAQDEYDSAVRNENVRRLAGETEEQILRTRIEANKKLLEAKKLHLENQIAQKEAALETSKTIRGYVKDIVTFLTLPLSAVLKAIDLANKAMFKTTDHFGDFQNLVSGWIIDTDQMEEDLEKFKEDTAKEIDDLNNKIAGDQIRLNDIYSKSNQKRLDDEKKLYDELRALRLKDLENQRSLQDQVDALTNEYFEKFLTDQEREQNAVQEKYWNLIEQAQQYGIDTAELEEARLYELEEIQKNFEAQREEREKAKRERELAEERMLHQQKIALAGNFFGAIGQLLGEQSRVGKAFAIAQALINTYQGISNVWAEKAESGLVGAGLIQRIATTAIVAAQGFATVKNIAKVKTPGGGSSSSGVGGGTANARPPSFNMIGDRGGVQDVNSGIDGQNQQPPRAYVVGGDVTTQQELDRNAVNASGF